MNRLLSSILREFIGAPHESNFVFHVAPIGQFGQWNIGNDADDVALMAAIAESFAAPSNVKTNTVINVKPRHLRHRKRCSVCQDQIATTQSAVHLKCKHYYHEHCIMEWGRYKQSCPVCRAPIPIK